MKFPISYLVVRKLSSVMGFFGLVGCGAGLIGGIVKNEKIAKKIEEKNKQQSSSSSSGGGVAGAAG